MRRERRKPDPGEFVDPLSEYDSPLFVDAFEQSLVESDLKSIEYQPFTSIEPTTTVAQAMKMMIDASSACIVIVENDKPIGIFTARDVQNKVADRYDELKDQPITEVMVRDPYIVYETDSPARVLNLMGSGGFRHVPVVDTNDKLVGMIGARRILSYLQQHFADVPGGD